MASFSEQPNISPTERGSSPPDAEVLESQENKIETQSNTPEKTEAQELASMDAGADTEFQSFETDQQTRIDGALRIGADLGFSEPDLRTRMESTGTRSALDGIKAKANDAYKGFKKVLAIGLGAVALSTAQEARPATAYGEKLIVDNAQEQVVDTAMLAQATKPELETPRVTSIDEAPEAQNTPPSEITMEQKSPAISEEVNQKTAETDSEQETAWRTESDIIEDVFEKDAELTYVGAGSAEHFSVLNVGNNTSVQIDIHRTRELAKAKSDIVSIHIHPLASYEFLGYSKEQIQQMRDGEIPIPQTPPSMMDFRSSSLIDYYLKKDNKDIHTTHRVYEPTGMWDIRLDAKHPFVRYMQKGNKALDRAVRETFSKLTPEERAKLGVSSKKIKSLADIPNLKPQILEDALVENKYAKKSQGIVWDAEEVLNDMEMVAVELRAATSASHSPETIDGLMRMYQGLCKRNGIDVKYTPYQPNSR